MAKRKNKNKYTSRKDISEDVLKKKLLFSVSAIFALIFLGIIGLNFFGPQIGALFGFISVNRNAEAPKVQASINPPNFANLPEATNKEELTIEGYSRPGATVKLYLNGPEMGETLTGGDGKFVFENINLIKGQNTVFAKAIDENGNESQRSETHTIQYDDDSPDIEITEPEDGSTIKNLNRRIYIQGKVSEKAKVYINNRHAVVKPDLSFDYYLGVDEGDLTIEVKAIDEAGNEKIEELFVKYEKEAD